MWICGSTRRSMHAGAPAGHPDEMDADHVYALLEDQVIPEFYRRNSQGIPQDWVDRIRRVMTDLVPRFSANRMMREYTESYYLPAIDDFHNRSDDGAARARLQGRWSARLGEHWDNVHWGRFVFTPEGETATAAVQVYLGDIEPDDVRVQLYADELGDQARYCETMTRSEAVPGAKNGFVYRLTVRSSRPPEHFTPRLISSPDLGQIPMESPLISWWHGDIRSAP